MVEEGNFVSRERLLSCARAESISPEKLYVGIDWGRVSDKTWVALGTNHEVLRWFVYPSVRYEEQIEMMMADLEPYRGLIKAVAGDSTGQGDFQMEYLESNTLLPVDESSFVKFTLQSKNEMYGLFDEVLFKPEGEEGRFTYPADDPHTVDFEAQMTELVREYKGDAEFLSPHHPDKPGAHDDAADCVALMLKAASIGELGDIIVI